MMAYYYDTPAQHDNAPTGGWGSSSPQSGFYFPAVELRPVGPTRFYSRSTEPKRVGHRVPESDPLVVNPGMTRSAWHREHRAPSPPVLGVARSQELRPFVPRAPVERRHRSSLRRFLAGV